MEISTKDWHLLSDSQLKAVKAEIEIEYSKALDAIWLREARERLACFDMIEEGSVLQVVAEYSPTYAVVTGKAKRGLGFSCWFLDGSVRDVALNAVLFHEVNALHTPLSSIDKTPLPKAIEELKLKYQEDVFG